MRIHSKKELETDRCCRLNKFSGENPVLLQKDSETKRPCLKKGLKGEKSIYVGININGEYWQRNGK